MRSFYLRFRVYAIENRPFLRNISPNLQASLVFLYANSLYASLIFWSLSLAYNEVRLYGRLLKETSFLYFYTTIENENLCGRLLLQRYIINRVSFRYLDPEAVFQLLLFVKTQLITRGLFEVALINGQTLEQFFSFCFLSKPK